VQDLEGFDLGTLEESEEMVYSWVEYVKSRA